MPGANFKKSHLITTASRSSIESDYLRKLAKDNNLLTNINENRDNGHITGIFLDKIPCTMARLNTDEIIIVPNREISVNSLYNNITLYNNESKVSNEFTVLELLGSKEINTKYGKISINEYRIKMNNEITYNKYDRILVTKLGDKYQLSYMDKNRRSYGY